jgi:hypothetical protein
MRIFLLTVFTIFVSITLTNAQNGSAYSRYGIGDINYGYSPKMLGIGDIGVTQLDPDHIITTNPASWAALFKTRLELSLGYKGVDVGDNFGNYFTSETEFRGFTFGFPVSRDNGIGVVAGLIPFSQVSYKAIKTFESNDVNMPSYQVSYEGKGGISKMFLGSSVNLPLGFIGGATLDYYFGNLRYYSNLEFINSTSNINTIFENNHRATGFGSTIGIITPDLSGLINLQPFSNIRLGLSVNYISNLNTDTLLTATSISLVDTFANNSTTMYIPLRINSGISFALGYSYRFNVDYVYQPWGEFKLGSLKDNNLRNAQRISAAFEYVPIRNAGMSVWEQIIWRGGLSYEETQYKFNGIGIDQFSVFGGLTFPLGIDNSIDLGIQYAMRGTKDNNLLKENFVKLYIGISFGELWFLRYEK